VTSSNGTLLSASSSYTPTVRDLPYINITCEDTAHPYAVNAVNAVVLRTERKLDLFLI